jgi:hypothetical protein
MIFLHTTFMQSPLIKCVLAVLVSSTLPILAGAPSTAPEQSVPYTAYRFDSSEGWRVGNPDGSGASRLEGRSWHFDFTRGSQSAALTLPDRSLLTRPTQFRLRVRGEAKGHPVSVTFRTHFMFFTKIVGEFTGTGEQELAFSGPPGGGWKWHGAKNDGQLHGPLRLHEIRLEPNGIADSGTLELVSLDVEGKCPSDRLCTMTADFIPSPENGTFRVNLYSLEREPQKGTLRWSIKDWNQKSLSQGQQSIELKPGGILTPHEVPLPTLPENLRFAEAEFSLEIPGQSVAPVQAYWLAPIASVGDTELQPESPFGMGIYLYRTRGDDMENVAKKAREAGVKWSREDFVWNNIEPRQGEFKWEFYDKMLDTANRNGITVYAIVCYWTSWSKNYTSEGVDQYVNYLRQLVRRYKGRVKQWEIWNEPNIFFWQGPKDLYAEMLKKSYAAVKEEDPSAQVLGISTAGIDGPFIDRMLQLGAPFDILTIHPYRKTFEDTAFIHDLKTVSDRVKLPDGTRRPVWLTEMGWATHVPHHVLTQDFHPVSQRMHAQLIARTYLCSIVSGIDPRTFWYNFRNDGEDPFYFEQNLGIIRRDGTPKPAYIVYATLAKMLEGMKYEQPIAAGPGILAHRFTSTRNQGKQVIVLWNPDLDAEVELSTPTPAPKLINAVGEPQPLQIKDGKMKIPLQAGSPVYLHFESSKPD